MRAWLVAVVPSLLYFFARVLVGADSLRAPGGVLDPAFAAYSILLAPLLETALMLLLAELLAAITPDYRRIRIVLLGLVFALAHRFGGGWQQVIGSAWPLMVYSVTLHRWRERSRNEAFVATSIVHALYNATIFGVGALGALGAASGT
jgi:hypothetical protein